MKVEKQVTEQPLCSKAVEQEHSKTLPEKAKAGTKKGLKFFIGSLLMKPAVWRWLIVHIPEYWEKGEEYMKQLINWFMDHS